MQPSIFQSLQMVSYALSVEESYTAKSPVKSMYHNSDAPD